MARVSWDYGFLRSGTYGGDLPRDIDNLCDRKLAGLDRALEIDFAKMLTEVKLLFDQSDVAVLDDKFNHGTLRDGVVESTGSLDREILPAGTKLVLVI